MEKISDNEISEVAGGVDEGSKVLSSELKKSLGDIFPKIKIKCVDCGKEIEVTDDSKIAWGMIGSEFERHDYYHERCHECALKHPYYKDSVENGVIIRDGAFRQAFRGSHNLK